MYHVSPCNFFPNKAILTSRKAQQLRGTKYTPKEWVMSQECLGISWKTAFYLKKEK